MRYILSYTIQCKSVIKNMTKCKRQISLKKKKRNELLNMKHEMDFLKLRIAYLLSIQLKLTIHLYAYHFLLFEGYKFLLIYTSNNPIFQKNA